MTHLTPRRNLLLLALASALTRGVGAAPEKANSEDKTLLFPDYVRSPQANRLRRVIEAAYANLGYQVVTEEMSTERGILEARYGNTAGEIFRGVDFEKEVPSFIRVLVPLEIISISTMTKAASRAAPTLEQAAQMQVGIKKGLRNLEALTVSWPKVEKAIDAFAMLKMLNASNVDVIIGFTENLHFTLEKVGLSPDLYSFREVLRDPVYHYLSPRHAGLVPAITVELNKIKGKYATAVEGFMARGDK